MDEFNPYSAPKTPLGLHTGESGIWRDGAILVMTKDAVLPNRCLKCNEPTEWKLKRNLAWHPPLVYLILLFNLIIYVIVALIVRNTAKVWFPVCELHRRKRRNAIAVGWLVALTGLISLPLLASMTDNVGIVLLVGIALILGGALYGLYNAEIARTKKIDKQFVRLAKVHPDFLEMLPPWIA